MNKLSHLNVSPKEFKVLLALFEYRGVTIDQLLRILGYNKRGLTNMYKPIRSLTELGYISAYSMSPKRSKKIYFLSPKGYSKMLELLDIPYDYKGAGFNRDYGDFPYELYKPPSNLKIHHLLLVDFLIEANNFKNEISLSEKEQKLEHSFDFRDNRYASREYTKVIHEEGSKPYELLLRFRPDAEVRINSNTCFIEIDLGTERGVHLSKKFEGYKQYFDHLKSKGKPLPSSIIFVSEEMDSEVQKNRRWQSISKYFLEILEDYATSVNLIYESIDKIKEVLIKEYNYDKNRAKALQQFNIYRMSNDYKGTKISYIDKVNGGFEWGKITFSISTYSNRNTVFAYERVDGYETKGWALLWKYNKYMENPHLRDPNFKNVSEVIPVLYYNHEQPVPPQYYVSGEKNDFFKKRLHFKTKGQLGSWQNKNSEDININPLIDYEIQTFV